MKGSSGKEKVLKLLRAALLEKDGNVASATTNYPEMYCPLSDEPLMVFAEKFVKGKGKFVYCADEKELIDNLRNLAAYRKWNKIVSFSPSLQSYLAKFGLETFMDDEDTTVGIGLCQSMIARTGSIIITSTQGAGTHLRHFTPIMVVIAFESQIQESYRMTLENMPEMPPQWVLNIKSGDLIEEEIRELYVFVIAG